MNERQERVAGSSQSAGILLASSTLSGSRESEALRRDGAGD